MLTNSATLANKGHDTLGPLGIYFTPFAMVYVTLNTTNLKSMICFWIN